MPVTVVNDQGLAPLLQALMFKQELELKKEELKLRQQESDLQTAERQNALQGLFQELMQGGAFAQEFAQSTPALAGAVAEQTLSPEELQDPQVLASVSGMAEARQSFMQRQAAADALDIIGRRAMEVGDPSILQNARAAINLTAAGVEASVVDDILPPGEKDLVALQAERVRLRGIEDVREADVEATRWLQEQGVLPESVPLIPGAAKTLLTVAEAREGDAIDWMQEGIDFVAGRVGDSVTGSLFTVNPDGSLSAGAASDQAVDVNQAIAEWRSIVTQFAPEGSRDLILSQLDSGIFARRLNIDRGVLIASDIIGSSGATPETLADIREILSEEFTDSEVTLIINRARARANSRTRR